MLNEYHLIKLDGETTLEDFETVLEFIQGLNGVGVNLLDKSQNTYNLLFEGTNVLTQISYDSTKKLIKFECSKSETITNDMMRFVAKNNVPEFKVYLPDLQISLPQKEKYLLCYGLITEEINSVRKVLTKTDFELIFVEKNPYANNWFAQDKRDGTMHFLNDNLIHYLQDVREAPNREELSFKVAENLQDFVRKADAELIPDHFYEYYGKNLKIINYSGFNIRNPGRKVFVKPYIMDIDEEKGDFFKIANDSSALLHMDKIRKGETLNDTILRILREELQIAEDYIGATVARTVEFDYDRNDKLTPRLLVYIYIEEAKYTEIQKKESKRGWISPKQVKDFQNSRA